MLLNDISVFHPIFEQPNNVIMRILTSIVLLIAFSVSALAGVSPKEKQALVDLYTATNGAEWN
ncbi:MAG: hypothetical protein ACI86L_002307, partial [Dokdonia sp.]